MTDYYDRKGVRLLGGMLEWSKLFEDDEYKAVAKTEIHSDEGNYSVSTVWLGMDHRFSQDGPPLIFETMIFGDGAMSEWMARYSTEQEALEGHAKICIALDECREFEDISELDDIHVDFDDDEFSIDDPDVIEI